MSSDAERIVPTWDLLISLRPELRQLLLQSQTEGRRNVLNGWYTQIKPRLERLIGMLATDLPGGHLLRTPRAYEVAYAHLYAAYEAARSQHCPPTDGATAERS